MYAFFTLCRLAIKCSLIGSLRFPFSLISAECTWAGEYKLLPWLDPCHPLNVQRGKCLDDLQGLVCVGRGDLGKGGPPVHPKLFLSKKIKISQRWKGSWQKRQMFFRLQRLTEYPLWSLKGTVTFENWNVQLQKGISGHCLHGICHTGYFLWRL